MKCLSRLKWALFIAAMAVMTAVLPAQAAMKHQDPVTLTVEGIRNGGKVYAGASLTFRASGGNGGGLYYLFIEVDGNLARYPMGEKGYLRLGTGDMQSSWTELPIGVHYSVKAVRGPGIGWYDSKPSNSFEFDMVYDEPSYYKLEASAPSRQYNINYWAGQYPLNEPPVLYRKENGAWKKYLSPLQLGAVYRYEIKDANGKVVSRDGLVKGCGTYTITAYELFTDPKTGKTVKVTAKPVKTQIADTFSAGFTVNNGVVTDYYQNVGGCNTDHSGVTNVFSGKAAAVKKPSKVKISSLSNKKGGKALLKFKKVKGASGYEVVYGTSKDLKRNVAVAFTKKANATLKGLTKKKTYYVKVRAYKTNAAGQKVYGSYSAVKKVKIRK